MILHVDGIPSHSEIIYLMNVSFCCLIYGVAMKEETGKAKKEVYGCGERGRG